MVVSSSEWALTSVRTLAPIALMGLLCSPFSWLAISSLILGLWRLGITSQRGFCTYLHRSPSWCIWLRRGIHILGLTWNSPSCTVCHRKVHNELLSIGVFKLQSCLRAICLSFRYVTMGSIYDGYWINSIIPDCRWMLCSTKYSIETRF